MPVLPLVSYDSPPVGLKPDRGNAMQGPVGVTGVQSLQPHHGLWGSAQQEAGSRMRARRKIQPCHYMGHGSPPGLVAT